MNLHFKYCYLLQGNGKDVDNMKNNKDADIQQQMYLNTFYAQQQKYMKVCAYSFIGNF